MRTQGSQSKNESEESHESSNKNLKIQDMLFTRMGVLLVSKVEVLVDSMELNCWRKRKEKEQLQLMPFDCGFLTKENADTFPIPSCRDSKSTVKRERLVANGSVPQHTSFPFLLVSSKIFVFAESF